MEKCMGKSVTRVPVLTTLGRLRTDQVLKPPVTRDRSNSKTRSLNDRTRFSPMPIVARVNPGTVDVRISEVKARRRQNGD